MDERQSLSLFGVSTDHGRSPRCGKKGWRMNNFAYARPASSEEAIRLGGVAGTMFLAGGTELLNWLRLGISAPAQVVDLGRIAGMHGIRKQGGSLVIGALTTLAEIEADPLVRLETPVLAEACLRAASPQIRNRATLGGNVLQKTRCVYFRAEGHLPWPCNKREPGSGCAALEGAHERHAIFGWTDSCVATQPSDPIVALASLEASIHVTGARRSREIPATEFHVTQEEVAKIATAADSAAQIETQLGAGELIVSFRIPLGAARRSAYVKVRERESYEYAAVSAAASVVIDAGRIQRARIALGSVAQKPWRLVEAEQFLIGKAIEYTELVEAVAASMKNARPLDRNLFKVRLAANAAVRALQTAGGRE
jgi:xanthine dehydrogenase YagS FAD-binding subunit